MTAPPKITSMAERNKLSSKEALQLQRQHHKFGGYNLEEIKTVLASIGLDENGAFQRATQAVVGQVDSEGNLQICIDDAGIHIRGKQACFLEIIPVASDRYDLRVIAMPQMDDGKDIPDELWAGGAEILEWAKDVPMAWMLTTAEKILGTNLREPMDANRRARAFVDKVNGLFLRCPCEGCEQARQNAKAKGTELADEKRELSRAAGEKDFDGIFSKMDVVRMLASIGDKAMDAMQRSTLAPEHATVN